MLLYKYISEQHWEKVLKDRKLRLSQPSVLNDIFEMRPNYLSLNEAEYVQEQLTDENIEAVSEEIFSEALLKMPQELRKLIPDGFLDKLMAPNLPVIKELAPKILESMSPGIREGMYSSFDQMVGVLCLSKKNNDPLMWAHYANSHQGLVIGFDSDDPFFNRKLDDSDELRHLKQVKYASKRPDVQVLELENGEDIFFTKHRDWAYECEWRMLLPLKDADEVIPNEKTPIYLFDFSPKCIKEVIFGIRTSPQTRDEVISYLSKDKQLSNAKVFYIDMDESEAKLNVVEST